MEYISASEAAKNGEYQRDGYRYFVVKAVCQAFQNLDICG